MSDEPKCPVDPATRDIWLKKTKASEKEQQNRLESLTSQQTNLRAWSFKNILWSSNPAPNKAEAVCPVPHDKNASLPKGHPTIPMSDESSKHNMPLFTRNAPEAIECKSDEMDQSLTTPQYANNGSDSLNDIRQISSIPRTNAESNWVYPSEKQFYNAMLRKQWNPEEEDMKTVVPLHNMVNEVAWKYILMWEKGQRGSESGDIKLTSFKGDSKKITPRAWIGHYIFGKNLPFDRHDWMVNRSGTEVEYVIDFYTTQIDGENEPRFFLDVRPKLNSLEGVRMRFYKALGL
ncbi:cytochrome c1 heme lyase [Martiniozyma asiatica (nom. inval.)]|nr:cytochrome c1 heme lyase [Martiniozyma asiatica]